MRSLLINQTTGLVEETDHCVGAVNIVSNLFAKNICLYEKIKIDWWK